MQKPLKAVRARVVIVKEEKAAHVVQTKGFAEAEPCTGYGT